MNSRISSSSPAPGQEKSIDQLITYPRRRVIRTILRTLISAAFGATADFVIEGKENIQSTGPLLVVGNHFHFLDPVVLIHSTNWPLEFVGGAQTPNAPSTVGWISRLWGVIPTYRGTGSRFTLKASQAVLAQKGVLAIFPEGGSRAKVLRPARPGTAFLATQMDAKILPVGIDGVLDYVSRVKAGKRARITMRFGKPFGPFFKNKNERPSREELNDIGDTIMRNIADLIPPERRGFYSDDPAIRAAAKGTEIYPWDGRPEV